MKKIIILALLVFATLFISCSCKTSNIDDFIIYDGILYKYIGNDEIVRIPGTYYQNGKRMKVTEIESFAFEENESIETIILPNTIKVIRDYAFNKSKIKSIKLSENIEEINGNIFRACFKLQYLNYDNNDLSKYTNLKIIDSYAFYYSKIDDLILPEGLTSIGYKLFGENYFEDNTPNCISEYGNLYYLGTKENPYEYMVDISSSDEYYLHKNTKLVTIFRDKLSKLHIEEGNEYYKIEDESLYQIKENKIVKSKQSDDENITCDEKVIILSENSYAYKSFNTIFIPDNVTKIERNAFFDTSVNTIAIGKCVEYMHPEAFNYCYVKEGFEVDEENQYYKSVNGVLYTKDGKHLVKAPNRVDSDELTIEEGTEVIDAYAFYKSYISTINVPESLKEVGASAFFDSRVKYFNQITPLNKIGESSFLGCSEITKVLLDDSIKGLPCYAFGFSDKLKIDKLPKNLEFIGPWALYGIEEYSEEILPENLKFIMEDAIATGMAMNIKIGKNVKYIGENAILFNLIRDTVKISEDNKYYEIKNGIIVRKDKN